MVHDLLYCVSNLNLVHDLVMLCIQKWLNISTETENVWSDFSYSGTCAVCENWYMACYVFFVLPLVCVIPDARRHDHVGLTER